MKFTPLKIAGAWLLEAERTEDERGYFERVWCRRELEHHGLETGIAQCSVSQNRRRGTLRGMHYQLAPHEETKLVGCLRGAIYDVVLDLRRDSPTWGRWQAIELGQDDHRSVYVPRGCAHGFQTLRDDTLVSYQISDFYSPEHARGIRWDDPTFGVSWPLPVTIIAERDRSFSLFQARRPVP